MRSLHLFLTLLGISHTFAATPQPPPNPFYWVERIKHTGVSAFNPDPNYRIFRNVMSYGAKGNGVNDDTAAIQRAIDAGGRCGAGCQSSTTTPAIIYFPAGTYLISTSIQIAYYTQIIGNANARPVLKASPGFSGGFGLMDGDVYGDYNSLRFGPTNIFFRTIRNMIFDMTSVPPSKDVTGLHWPTAQATSLQNCLFRMSSAEGTDHKGIFIESGSGGFMSDLVFEGGKTGVVFGNQQFTVRNLAFYNVQTAINQLWNWGWTYQGITIVNCGIGLQMSGIDNDRQTTGSVTFIDSTFTDTGVAFHTAFNPSSQPPAGGSLILENISFTRVRTAVQGPGGTVLGTFVSTTVISSWGQGNTYNPAMAGRFQNTFNPLSRPSSLTTMDGKYYTRSKPQYETLQLSSFLSVRGQGATGDGRTDDTVKINQALIKAAAEKKVLFFDAGTYRVTRTIRIPPGSRIVGESYSVIMGAGPFFSDIRSPRPVVQVGDPNVIGIVEWSDMIVSTQGATAGAILIQWDLASDSKSPSGMWDVHTRIGGFAGSQLQFAECPARRESSEINPNCKAAFISMYISPLATGIYLENTWFWTADHDIEDPALRQITVYAGRGIHCASVKGIIWMVGTGVEHHDLYQYQFVNTKDIYAGQIQSETAYWQPNPVAGVAYPPVSAWKDPVFTQNCQGVGGNCASGWGLRIFNSRNIRIYGAGLYSFFDNYLTTCSSPTTPGGGNGAQCQSRIFSLEGSNAKNVVVYNLNTIGAPEMVTRIADVTLGNVNNNIVGLANYADNVNVFPDTIAYLQIPDQPR